MKLALDSRPNLTNRIQLVKCKRWSFLIPQEEAILWGVSPARRKTIYAIFSSGGKQYQVSPGQVVDVEQLPGEAGTSIELDQVLLIADDTSVVVGKPVIAGARVQATIINQGRHAKITVFKYKRKVRYRRKRGHRQSYTRLAIDQIISN